jgi:hypothetical protein
VHKSPHLDQTADQTFITDCTLDGYPNKKLREEIIAYLLPILQIPHRKRKN